MAARPPSTTNCVAVSLRSLPTATRKRVEVLASSRLCCCGRFSGASSARAAAAAPARRGKGAFSSVPLSALSAVHTHYSAAGASSKAGAQGKRGRIESWLHSTGTRAPLLLSSLCFPSSTVNPQRPSAAHCAPFSLLLGRDSPQQRVQYARYTGSVVIHSHRRHLERQKRCFARDPRQERQRERKRHDFGGILFPLGRRRSPRL